MSEARMTSVDEFIQKSVPDLIKGRERLNVVISTYGRLPPDRLMPISETPPGLQIFAQVGEANLEFKKLLGNAAPTVAFFYFGRRGKSEPIEAALEFQRAHGAKVVLVACDCDWRKKLELTAEHILKGEIQDIVFGPLCGGEFDLPRIRDAIIRSWPERLAS
ncbi:hypothetical protein KBC59_04860 [Patescibacteria group bacterium]|nr:hypothetical protein [Patescibacteria group bacterium]